MSLREATERAIAGAPHLTDARYAGSVEALLMLADKADQWHKIVEFARDDLEGQDGRKRPAVPANDNTTLGTYTRLAEQLGLTPIGRKSLDGVGAANGGATPAGGTEDEPKEARRGKLALISSLPGAGGPS